MLRLAQLDICRQSLDEKDRALRDALHTVAWLCRKLSALQGAAEARTQTVFQSIR